MAPSISAARTAGPPSDAEILAAGRGLGGLARDSADLWRELSDPQVEARRLASVLHADPGIAARVVKVANSAFYGRGRQVSSIDRAIVVLGLDAVRGIAAAAGLDRVVPRGVAGAAFATHCTVNAALARALAREVDAVAPADAFLAGLLHDFGLLVAWRLAAAGRVPDAPEPEVHARWGARVLEAWMLPPAIVESVALHHADGGGPMSACVRLAHDAALSLDRALASDPAPRAMPCMADLAVLRLDAEHWRRWLDGDAVEAMAEGLALAA